MNNEESARGYTDINAVRTLNLAAGANPLSQLVGNGPNGGMPSLITRLRDGLVGDADGSALGGAEIFVRFMRTNRFALNTAAPNMEQALVQATDVPLTPLPGTRQGVDITGNQVAVVPQFTKQNSLT